MCVKTSTAEEKFAGSGDPGNEVLLHLENDSTLSYMITPPDQGGNIEICKSTTSTVITKAEIRRSEASQLDGWGVKDIMIDGEQYNRKDRGTEVLWLDGNNHYGDNRCPDALWCELFPLSD